MLNTLRKGAGTWVAKIFIGLLVISFGIWGIADIFSGYGTRVLAKVGDVEIPPQEYERSLQQQIRRFSQQLGRQITTEQARAFGLDRQVLNSLITNAAVSSHARQLGLGISDSYIRDQIFKSPAFKGADGKFSRIRFDEVLRNNNLNEAAFIQRQRTGTIRDQLILALSSDIFVPESMVRHLNRYDNDTRTLQYFILPKTAVKTIEDPDEKVLQAFLDNNKRTFTAPEYRKIGVLTLSPAVVQKNIKITKEDIEASYNERLDQFSIPGKRHIRRMSFIDREKAREARKELMAGTDFMTVAKKYGFREKGTDLGFIDKVDLPVARVADAAFSLKKGEISPIIEGTLSNTIVQVVDIRPGKIQKKLADVEDEIRKFLLAERAADKIGNLHDMIEDERASGKSLAEIARQFDLKYTIVPAVDRNGLDMKGNKITTISLDPRLLRAVFESDIGVENEPVESNDNIVHWPEVLGITPERLKPLSEVRKQVLKMWKERQTEIRLGKTGSDILAALRKGEKLEKFAKKYKAKLLESKPFKRGEEHDDIPAAAVSQAFVLPVSGVGMSSLADGKGRVIFRVKAKTAAPELSAKERKKRVSRIRASRENDVVVQYVADLRQKFGVTINRKVLQRLNGTTQ